MIRFLLRALGFLLVAAAFAALVVDGTRSIAGGRLLQYSFGEAAAWAGGGRYAALVGELAGAPEPVRQLASVLLAVPGWIVMGALGLLLLYAGRPAAERIGPSGRRI